MPRTHKHKYKRKICNSRRSIYMNKRKMKTKTKSKPRSRRGGTRKIFKKSHKRYVIKGMKRRIQRGGSKNDHYLKLMALLYDEPDHQWSKSYMTVSGISDYNKFLEVLSERRVFGLELGNLPLEEVICSNIPKDKLYTTDMEFALKMVKEGKIIDIQKWKDFIDSMRTTISNEERRKNSLDMEDYYMLRTKSEIYCEKAKTEKEIWLKDQYARICLELNTFLLKNAGKFTRGTGPTVVFLDREAQFNQKKTAIPRVEVESTTLDSSQFEPTLKTYLGYRLSDGRRGCKLGYGDDKIRTFNQNMKEINTELQRTLDKYGERLYILLEDKRLIPVYFKTSDERDDSIPDSDCLKSVRNTPFVSKFLSLSSGKHHCRTCGRCMNDADTRRYNADPKINNMLLNPVCIDCFELFSGVLTPGPGGSAASLSSAAQ